MIEFFTLLIEYQKQKRETKRFLKKLKDYELDYEGLQKMIDNVSLKNVEIEIDIAGGKKIYIRPTSNDPTIETFRDKWNRSRS